MTLYLPNISFVAVPKTASISIERAFCRFANDFKPHQHDSVDKVKACSNNPCIAVIRHPLRWIESYYKYLRFSPYFAHSGAVWGLHSKSFEQFVWAYVRGQHLWPEPLRHQVSYVSHLDQTVEHLYRFENLADAVNHLCDSVGAKIELQIHNVSRECDLYLSTKARAAYEKVADRDYELYESVRRD